MRNKLSFLHHSHVKHPWRSLLLGAIPSIFALITTGVAVEVYFPYLPTEREVAEFLRPSANRDGLTSSFPDQFEVLDVKSLDQWQIALSAFKQHHDQTPCFTIDFVTKHRLSGLLRTELGTGACYSVSKAKSTILLASLHHNGYAVGGVVIDERIVRVQATWLDGTQSIYPIDQGGFLIVRPDDIGLAWVVGLNNKGAITNNSLTYDDRMDISPLSYGEIHQVVTSSGVIILGAYSQTTPVARECIQLMYATAENFKRSLSGQTYFTAQTACIEFTGQSMGPSVGTIIDGNSIVAGRFLDKAIAAVRIQWSDGQQQTAPVDNGFYFAQRPGSSVALASMVGLDGDGNVIAP